MSRASVSPRPRGCVTIWVISRRVTAVTLPCSSGPGNRSVLGVEQADDGEQLVAELGGHGSVADVLRREPLGEGGERRPTGSAHAHRLPSVLRSRSFLPNGPGFPPSVRCGASLAGHLEVVE